MDPDGTVDEDAVHSGPLEGVELQGFVLGVGADAGVPDLVIGHGSPF